MCIRDRSCISYLRNLEMVFLFVKLQNYVSKTIKLHDFMPNIVTMNINVHIVKTELQIFPLLSLIECGEIKFKSSNYYVLTIKNTVYLYENTLHCYNFIRGVLKEKNCLCSTPTLSLIHI